jgi:hypothetical protein
MYRIDKFMVPISARTEFLVGLHKTHEFLKTLDGFVQDFVVEKEAGPGAFNVLTLVEWDSVESLRKAVIEVRAMHQRIAFDRQKVWDRYGITADLAEYQQLID